MLFTLFIRIIETKVTLLFHVIALGLFLNTGHDTGHDAGHNTGRDAKQIPVQNAALNEAWFTSQSTSPNSTPVYESLVSRFQRGEIFTATFDNITTDSFTGEESAFRGTIWLGLDRYRVETRDQILVVSESTSIVLDRVRNRFILSDYRPEDDDVAPSRTLSRIDSSMTVREMPLRNGSTRVDLESTDPYAPLLRISIVISKDELPVSIEALDQVENEIVTRFTKGRWIRATADLFTLDPPSGSEVLDLRGS